MNDKLKIESNRQRETEMQNLFQTTWGVGIANNEAIDQKYILALNRSCFINQQLEFEVISLTDREPVSTSQHWSDMIHFLGASEDLIILNELQPSHPFFWESCEQCIKIQYIQSRSPLLAPLHFLHNLYNIFRNKWKCTKFISGSFNWRSKVI